MAKRIGVAGIIINPYNTSQILLGRRNKDPNRGLYVLPGGGVEDNESLEEAFQREIKEETGLLVEANTFRWTNPYIIELGDRIILVGLATAKPQITPQSGSDLYDVGWFDLENLPDDISSVVRPIITLYKDFLDDLFKI